MTNHTGANSYQGGVIAERSILTEYMRHRGMTYNPQASDTERGYAEGVFDASLMLLSWQQRAMAKEPSALQFPVDVREGGIAANNIREDFERITGHDLTALLNAFVGQPIEQEAEQPKVTA